MIGTWGFLEELSFVVFPLVLLLVVVMAIRRTPRTGGGYSFKGVVALLVLVLLPTVFGWRFVKQIQIHHFLGSLTTEGVESFSIGARQVTDERGKSLMVQGLRGVQWFSPHHGGWSQPVDLRIKLRSGEEKYFRMAMYIREPGVVIDFAEPKGRGGLHAGYAFSRTLRGTLADIGIELPH